MHTTAVSAVRLAHQIQDGVGVSPGIEIALAPPYPYLSLVADVLSGEGISLAAQNLHAAPEGAHTGEVSAKMLADVGCRFVIVGHSERRAQMGETASWVADKALAASHNALQPIVCVGESAQERREGETEACIRLQLQPVLRALAGLGTLIVAYEPVWAIGTGDAAEPEQVQQVHQQVRAQLLDAGFRGRLLYGGSVTVDNAPLLLSLPDVDGLLVGGASLRAEGFVAICRLAQETLKP